MRVTREVQLKHTLSYLMGLYEAAKNSQVVFPSKLARSYHVSSYTSQAVIDTNILVFYRESPKALCRIKWVCGQEPDLKMAELVADKATLLKLVKPHQAKPMPETKAKAPKKSDKLEIEINGVRIKIPKSDTLQIKVGNSNNLILL